VFGVQSVYWEVVRRKFNWRFVLSDWGKPLIKDCAKWPEKIKNLCKVIGEGKVEELCLVAAVPGDWKKPRTVMSDWKKKIFLSSAKRLGEEKFYKNIWLFVWEGLS
jgi:hypothetical protein